MKSVVVPTKFLCAFLVQVQSDDEGEVREKAQEIAKVIIENTEVKNALFNASREISKVVGSTVLIVPGYVAPVTDEKDAELVFKFTEDYLERIAKKEEGEWKKN